jgi:hypothetical protein
MKRNLNGILPVIAALVVIFTNMWAPDMTFAAAVGVLLVLSVYHFFAGSGGHGGDSRERDDLSKPLN